MAWARPDNITSISGWATWLNTVTNGLFWPVSSLMLFIISFVALKQYQTVHAFLVSSVLVFLYSVFMAGAGLIGVDALALPIVLIIVAVIAAYFER